MYHETELSAKELASIIKAADLPKGTKLSAKEILETCSGELLVSTALPEKDSETIHEKLNAARRNLFPTIHQIISEAHSARKTVKPTETGVEGFIAEVRSQGAATDKEVLLLKMIVPGYKPGYFRWNTASDSEASYNFGKRIISELDPEIHSEMALLDQLNTRIFVHTDKGHDRLQGLVGKTVRIMVKEGKSDGNGDKFPDEWVPNPIQRKPMKEDAFRKIIEAQAASMNTEDGLGSFGE